MNKRILAIIISVVVLVGAIISVTMLLSRDSTDRPLSAAELLQLGEKYLLELEYEQALVQFLAVIEVEPMNPRGYTGAAEAHVGLEQPVEAINIVHTGMKTIGEPETVGQPLFVWLEDFGDLMFTDERFDLSALAYEALLAENPQSEYAYKLAQAYIASGRIDEAIELLKRMADLFGDDGLRWEAERLEQLYSEGNAVGLIRIIDVSPKTAPVGQETTYSVTVRYASANTDGCIIYAGANTGESTSYTLYDEYLLPDTFGIYTFQFSCVPVEWPDAAFGIYVNISEYPHPERWTPFSMDIYDLTGRTDIDLGGGNEPITTAGANGLPQEITDIINYVPTAFANGSYGEIISLINDGRISEFLIGIGTDTLYSQGNYFESDIGNGTHLVMNIYDIDDAPYKGKVQINLTIGGTLYEAGCWRANPAGSVYSEYGWGYLLLMNESESSYEEITLDSELNILNHSRDGVVIG